MTDGGDRYTINGFYGQVDSYDQQHKTQALQNYIDQLKQKATQAPGPPYYTPINNGTGTSTNGTTTQEELTWDAVTLNDVLNRLTNIEKILSILLLERGIYIPEEKKDGE